MDIQAITPAQVVSVYSGRPGCMCGCRGKHYYGEAHVVYSSRHRGSPILPEEVNNGMVTKVLRILQASDLTKVQGDYILFATIGKRQYAAYLVKE